MTKHVDGSDTTPPTNPDGPTDQVAEICAHFDSLTTTAVTELRRHGITPTLGIVTPDPEGALLAEDFHAAWVDTVLTPAATRLGLAVRVVPAGPEPRLPGDRLAALAALDARPRPDQFEEAADELRAHREADGPPAPPGFAPADTDMRLGDWVRRSRLRHVLPAVEELVADPTVHAVVCCPPLPAQVILDHGLRAEVPRAKDVDGLHSEGFADWLPPHEQTAELIRHGTVLSVVASLRTAPTPVVEMVVSLLLLGTARRALLAHQAAPSEAPDGKDDEQTAAHMARDFHSRHGHLEPVRTLRVDDVDVRAWVDRQRERAQALELDPSRRAAPDELGMHQLADELARRSAPDTPDARYYTRLRDEFAPDAEYEPPPPHS